MTSIESRLRDSVERGAHEIEQTRPAGIPSAPVPMAGARGADVAASRRGLRLSLAAAVLAALALAGAVKAPEVLTAATSPDSRPRDVYDDLYGRVSASAVPMPTERPPSTEFVLVSSSDGVAEVGVQHPGVTVSICGRATCHESGELIRTVEVGGTRFRVEVASVAKVPSGPVVVPDDIRRFWETATFTDTRPEWLVTRLYPGVVPAPR